VPFLDILCRIKGQRVVAGGGGIHYGSIMNYFGDDGRSEWGGWFRISMYDFALHIKYDSDCIV